MCNPERSEYYIPNEFFSYPENKEKVYMKSELCRKSAKKILKNQRWYMRNP